MSYYQDYLYDDSPWAPRRPMLRQGGRLIHVVYVDGRLVDAWSEDPQGTRYDEVAEEYDEERRPQVVHTPPPLPRHERTLEWLDSLVGGRAALLVLTADPAPVPPLRDVVDPVADEPWLVADEVLGDLTDRLLPADLEAPLRSCLLLLRERDPHCVERVAPARIAAGVAWVVGKANGSFQPAGPARQVDVSRRLGVSDLHTGAGLVKGLVCRPGPVTSRPRDVTGTRELLATGRPELLSASLRADLVDVRDRALADQAAVTRQGVTPPEA